jgi:hypothetical protein
MKKKYLLELSEKEREYLHKLISSGTASARKLNRARILLKAEVVTVKHPQAQALSDRQIARMLCRPPLPQSNKGRANASTREDSMPRWNALSPIGSTSVLFRRACRSAPDRPGCSEPPRGRNRWSLRLLADKAVELWASWRRSPMRRCIRHSKKLGRQSPLE